MTAGDRKDRVFARPLSEVKAFEFNESVAHVFQDMISRSVPGYALLLRMIGLYADLFVTAGSRVYDLGCSLGEASLVIAEQVRDAECRIIAVDNSSAMIEKCRQHNISPDLIEWHCEDIRQIPIDQASMVVLNLTLQFLPPKERLPMLKKIYTGLNPGGVLVLSEKVVFEDEAENECMLQLYQGFKKTMGYSDLEISQKRNALENVLIPDSEQQHRQRLVDAGFSEIYPCFRGFNFVSYLAIKT
ncbi:MAG: carboxy-S-adenosyl-L-methionine synthase CmoA [Gammaproteobacteria bacterium]|nr:MAG: carboxy-S-adenosyl-L-methionine synthase CmoA [Gammaproteobacteria bacterium]UCH39529.1 MAG: carboxy-S-adenosyl-L-methionine synthase CmoA [Gammaproteobacteria bacterium]